MVSLFQFIIFQAWPVQTVIMFGSINIINVAMIMTLQNIFCIVTCNFIFVVRGNIYISASFLYLLFSKKMNRLRYTTSTGY